MSPIKKLFTLKNGSIMKKLYFLILGGGKVKISYLLLAFLFATTTAATAEVLLNENFEYEEGYLYNQGSWVKYSSHAKDSIRVVNTPLTYDGYQTTPIGKAVRIGSSDTQGQDLMKHFCDTGFVKANSFYLAALVNIEQAGTNYFLTLLDSASYAFADGKAPTEKLRLLATPNSENDNQFYFEIAKGNASSVKTTQAYELHTTYWVVIKYEFIIAATDSATTKTDDKILLYINPTSTTTPTESSANAILSGDTYGSDIAWRGTNGIQLKQGATSTKTCPTLTIDAIRVATTWDELFPSATPDPDPEPEPTKPAIIAPTGITFNEVFSNEQYEQKITVKGTDLEDDVTFASTCDQVTLSATSATKEQVMSADGFELTLTLKATGETCDPKLTITSKNAPTVEVPIAWTVLPTIDVADLAELRAKAATVDLEALPAFRITNPVVVSYQDGDNYIYLQDDKGGIRMKDELGVVSATTLPTGTKIAAGLLGTVSDKFGYEFIPYCDITIDGTAEVKAVTATLAEIDADKAAYVDRLVRLEHVTFNKEEERVFGAAKDTIIQEGYKAALRLFSSVTDIAGKTIPAQATVVGISTSTSALLIAPRGWSDITGESSTVAIDKATAATICYTQAGMLIVENATTDIAVYNLTGICVAKAAAMPYASFTLPQGVYAVKMNGQTCKVVVK